MTPGRAVPLRLAIRPLMLGECVAASPVVAQPGLLLASSAPAEPGPDVPGVGGVSLEQAGQQPADLGHGVADHAHVMLSGSVWARCRLLRCSTGGHGPRGGGTAAAAAWVLGSRRGIGSFGTDLPRL